MVLPEREVDLVHTFVVAGKRERLAGFLSSPKRRPKFVQGLCHFNDFDAAFQVHLSGDIDSAQGLLADLRRRGAGDECYVMSVDRDLDGVTGLLAEVIERVFACAEGTIVSCVPGRLAYYEGKGRKNRFILDREAGRTG